MMNSVSKRMLYRINGSATAFISKRALATESEALVKTTLYDMHKELGGDMVPFAGYELPVLYKRENGGVKNEHLWCREEGKCALFDVSHMGQVTTIQLTTFYALLFKS